MATFTMYLKDVIEHLYGTTDDPDDFEQTYESLNFNGVTYGKLPTLPDYTKIGLGTYPIFDEGYRKILNGKIIDEYYVQEIGVETIDIFILNIRKNLDQIMPYYNQLYETMALEYGALDTMRIHSVSTSATAGNEEVIASNEATTDAEAKSRAVASETPQTMLAGRGDYATSATDSKSENLTNATGSQESNANSNTQSDSDTLVTGYQAVASDLVMRYRASLINIDTMIIQDLADNFMRMLNNGDAYHRNYTYYWLGW